MIRKKRRRKRTWANRLAWGAPFFVIALIMLVLAIWAPWHAKIGKLKDKGVTTWADLTDAEVHMGRTRLQVAVTFQYTFYPSPYEPPITAKELVAHDLIDVLLQMNETRGQVEVVYLPDDPRVSSLAATLPFKGGQLSALSFVLGGAALLVAMAGVAATALGKEGIIELLSRPG